MGVGIFSRNSENNTLSPNPNPEKFSIIKTEFVGNHAIREVYYIGCTTFNGRKLLLQRDKRFYNKLDPHLLGNNHPVIARFEPTEEGWMLARLCAEKLNESR